MTTSRPDLVERVARQMADWRSTLARPVPTGLVLYEGPSALGAGNVVVVMTGIESASTNSKTADMLQSWILPADEPPTEASRSGLDVLVCGDCKHRPIKGGVCYVNLAWGPYAVWKAWKAGKYTSMDSEAAGTLLAGSLVRFGAWGDPAAVPLETWTPLLPRLRAWTGYTHQWKGLGPEWREWLMASVDSPAERAEAKAAGWRTFRGKEPEDPLLPGEVLCLSDWMGIPCGQCKGCDGLAGRRKLDYVINYHGNRWRLAWLERQVQLPFNSPERAK